VPAYYNEFDPEAAQWLRDLIKAGLIAPGDVDERDIRDVCATDLVGYRQCHFFAGIGGWSLALRLAGWPDDRPVWTGSCPCQPFSAAGKGEGFADERHLWPAFFHLIEECRPVTLFGEQVASKDGLTWLDLVHADLEGTGYTVGATDLCAAGIGAPHIRQRIWFVADSDSGELPPGRGEHHSQAGTQREIGIDAHGCGRFGAGSLADTQHSIGRAVGLHREDGRHGANGGRQETHGEPGTCGEVLGMAHAADGGRQHEPEKPGGHGEGMEPGRTGPKLGVVCGDADRLEYSESDGRNARRAEPIGGGIAGGCGLGGMGHAASAGPLPGAHGGIHHGQESAGPRDAEPQRSGAVGGVDNPAGERCTEHAQLRKGQVHHPEAAGTSEIGGIVRLGDPSRTGLAGREGQRGHDVQELTPAQRTSGPVNGFWQSAYWLPCTDGKHRPAEPGAFPLAHGLPRSVGSLPDWLQRLAEMAGLDGHSLKRAKTHRISSLKGYGNAIVPEVAAEFIMAYLDVMSEVP
jgi:DNA (cytosine-5)-methyltransferase 1